MLFNSYEFIFAFLPITLILFFWFSKLKLTKLALIWLTFTSFFFYSFWNIFTPDGNPSYVLLIILSIVFNHQMGSLISSANPPSKKSKYLLIFGTVINLLFIGYYKYAAFLISIFNDLTPAKLEAPNLILPLGISFYTFTQIAYLVDAYRGELKENRYNLLEYSLFVIFFPQLIAGPILRHDELIFQFYKLKNYCFSQKNFALGLSLFCIGLSKKVLIADNLSPWVSPIFSNTANVNFIEAWVGALAYTFQLYFDFSGYSDMAVGLGWMFNINLPINFNSPYKAESISDFWRRWHITLSNFLRDYLYIPLGGSRKGETRRYVNLIITMLLGGFWHGAGWAFILWGGLHGIYLSVNHWWRKLNIPLPKILGWLITFLAVIISWVLFRATTLQDGMNLLTTMCGLNGIVIPGEAGGKLSFLSSFGISLTSWGEFDYMPQVLGKPVNAIFTLGILTLAVKFLPNSMDMVNNLKPKWWIAVSLGLMAVVSLLSLNRVSEFLYFQF